MHPPAKNTDIMFTFKDPWKTKAFAKQPKHNLQVECFSDDAQKQQLRNVAVLRSD